MYNGLISLNEDSLVFRWQNVTLSKKLDANRRYHNKIAKAIKMLPQGLLLDAGCGTGRFTGLIDSKSHTVAVDLVRHNCIKTKRALGAEVVCADVRELPFRDRTFEGVLSIQVLGAFRGTEKALSEYARILKPGGHVLTTFLNSRTPYVLISRLRRTAVERLNRKDVHGLASKYSFKVSSIEVTGIPLPTWAESRISFADPFLGNDILLQAES